MPEQVIAVNMGQLEVSRRGGDVLAALGLGSCVAVCVYDPRVRMGGMIHVVLPSSAIGREREGQAKFADLGVPRLVAAMVKEGGSRQRLRLVMAGGANVLSSMNHGSALDIGSRNVAAVLAALETEKLSVWKSDVGGKTSRTVRLSVASGTVRVKTLRMGEKVLATLGGGNGQGSD